MAGHSLAGKSGPYPSDEASARVGRTSGKIFLGTSSVAAHGLQEKAAKNRHLFSWLVHPTSGKGVAPNKDAGLRIRRAQRHAPAALALISQVGEVARHSSARARSPHRSPR